ncbi:unnamed protein product, partial [marine sediment metagenome]
KFQQRPAPGAIFTHKGSEKDFPLIILHELHSA